MAPWSIGERLTKWCILKGSFIVQLTNCCISYQSILSKKTVLGRLDTSVVKQIRYFIELLSRLSIPSSRSHGLWNLLSRTLWKRNQYQLEHSLSVSLLIKRGCLIIEQILRCVYRLGYKHLSISSDAAKKMQHSEVAPNVIPALIRVVH